MTILWSARAKRELKHIAEWLDYVFGKRAANLFADDVEYWTDILAKNPEIGHSESLLADKKIHYRSLIFTKHNKLIYYIKSESIYISDIWDMRRKPEILANRIRTQ